MRKELFRKDVALGKSSQLDGDVLLIQPISNYMYTNVLAALVFTLLIFLFLGKYDHQERVNGHLVPNKGVIKVYAKSSGIVSEVYVATDELVEKGQPLFLIENISSNRDGSDRDQLLLKGLRDNLKEVDYLAQQELEIFEYQQKALKVRLETAEKEKAQIFRISRHVLEEYNNSKETFESSKMLNSKGILSEKEFRVDESKYLAAEIKLARQRQSEDSITSKVEQLTHENSRQPAIWNKKRTELTNQSNELNKKIIEIQDRRSFVVTAPVSGILASKLIEVGQSVGSEKPLVSIIPKGSHLTANIFLPSRSAGLVNEGLRVKIRYSAFPYQHYGHFEGRIKSVSKTILNPIEVELPQDSLDPVYRAGVEIDVQAVETKNGAFPLQAGMTLEADIVLESRTFIEWILSPLRTF